MLLLRTCLLHADRRFAYCITQTGISWEPVRPKHGRTTTLGSQPIARHGNIRYLHYSLSRREAQQEQRKRQLTEARSRTEVSIAKKVVEAGKDLTYLGIVIFGICITGALFYIVGYELLSSQTPYGVFSAALKRCQQDSQVQDELGDPIKGHGERDRRGRSRRVSHLLFEKDGIEYMRMVFYLKGSIRSGTVHHEVFKGASGKWETRYLFVEVDQYPHKVMVIEDNR